MRNLFFIALLLIPSVLFSQTDTTRWPRAFPITSYIFDLNDTIKIVQINLPQGTTVAEKQVGLLKGMYRDKQTDTATIGTGRCNLIKGDYYYYTINYKVSGILPREGDLLYTMIKRTPVYNGQLLKIATNFTSFQNVYEQKWFDRYTIFSNWSAQDEKAVLDSMLNDIHFTGKYFLENNPSMNVKIDGGRYDGKMVLNTMTICTMKDLTDFLDYIIARPRMYAGHEWKIAEIFATWLTSKAPSVIRNGG
jgi:hypothetical protein